MLTRTKVYTHLKKILEKDNILKVSNKYFIGCFLDNGVFSETENFTKKCQISVDLFEYHFNKYFKDLIIISSLYVDYKKLKKNTLEYSLSGKTYILPISEGIILDKNLKIDEDMYDNIYSELELSMRLFYKNTERDILDLSYVSMESDVLGINSGFLFYLIPQCNILVYPHADIGFGAYCLELNKENREWNSFLKDVNEEFFKII